MGKLRISAAGLMQMVLCAVPLLAGCTQPDMTDSAYSDREVRALEQLRWVEAADAQADAVIELAAAVSEARRPRLLALATRGLSYPGLSDHQLKQLRELTDKQIAPGSGDVIYGDRHRELYVRLTTYARDYNQAIYAAVVPNDSGSR